MYLTYMTGQVLLVLGMCQGQGAGWQVIAGGFHFIPGLLVYVLEEIKKFVNTGTMLWVAPTYSPVSQMGFVNPGEFFQCEV